MFDFELTQEEMARMASLNQEKRYFNMTYQQIKGLEGALDLGRFAQQITTNCWTKVIVHLVNGSDTHRCRSHLCFDYMLSFRICFTSSRVNLW